MLEAAAGAGLARWCCPVAASILHQQGEGSCVEVRAGGKSAHSLLPPTSDDALMREELSILGTDPVFERVLG